MKIGTSKRIELGAEPVFSDTRIYDKAYAFELSNGYLRSIQTEDYVAPYDADNGNIYLKANDGNEDQQWDISEAVSGVEYFITDQGNHNLIVAENEDVVMEGEEPGSPITWEEMVVASVHENEDPDKNKQKWVFKKIPPQAKMMSESELNTEK